MTLLNNPKKAAVLSGIALLIMTVAAMFSYGYAHTQLFSELISFTTLKNLENNPLLAYEILGWFIIILMDLVVSWGFYTYLKPVHSKLAKITGFLRLIYTCFLFVATLQLVGIQKLVRDTASEEMIPQVSNNLDQFNLIWQIALILFGFHLIATGLTTFYSKGIPKIYLILLIAAGVGYIATSTLLVLAPSYVTLYKVINAIMILPMIVGELGFGLWLLFKGHKVSNHN